jgi:hypothetical protein
MTKLKDWLLGALGSAGFIVYLFILVAMNVLPMIILDFPWWAVALVCLALSFFEWSQFLYLGVWIWAFVVALGQPIDWISILFFVAFVVYIGTIISAVVSAFRS